jgi:tetratricopeptide (TPR) repeat protein
MANFYLGLVYYMRHEYNNARAAFENSLFKLRDYGEGKEKADEYRMVESNFALAYLMLGRCWQRLGDEEKARTNFDRAVQLRPYLAPVADPERNRRSNLLLVVDFGHAPQKVTNYDGAIVGFAPTPREAGPIPPPLVLIDGRPANLAGAGRPPVDLLALAQDRRWQDIDTIRTIKTTVGTGLIGVGAYEGLRSRNRSNQLAGLAMVGAGLLLKASSQADVRQWEMLPRTTFLLPLEAPPGTHDVTVEFPNVPGLRQMWRNLIVPPDGQEATYYFRMERYNSGPFTWPPPAMARVEAGPAQP